MITGASLDREVLMLPPGRRHHLMLVALWKWLAVLRDQTDAQRLDALEILHRQIDEWMTPARLALVDPASTFEVKVIDLACSLDPPDGRADASFGILTSQETFRLFVRANAGMRRAVMLNTYRTGAPTHEL